MRPIAALACGLLLGSAADAQARDPAIDYTLECRGCHLADGAGAGTDVPDLRDSVGRFVSVPDGRAYLVRVPGSSQAPLDDAALAAVLNWMIRRFGPEDVAQPLRPFDAAEVAGFRSEPLLEFAAERRRLLELIADAKR